MYFKSQNTTSYIATCILTLTLVGQAGCTITTDGDESPDATDDPGGGGEPADVVEDTSDMETTDTDEAEPDGQDDESGDAVADADETEPADTDDGDEDQSDATSDDTSSMADAGSSDATDQGDAGQSGSGSWTSLTDYPKKKAGPTTDMHFYTDKKGWMAVDENQFGNNGGFYYTSDGGRSWEYRKKKISASAVTTVDNGNKVIGFGSSDADYNAWTSTDGKSWKPVFSNVWPPRQTTELENVVFWSDQVGLGLNFAGTELWRTTEGLEKENALKHHRLKQLSINSDNDTKGNCLPNDIDSVGDEIWMAAGNSHPGIPNNAGACVLHGTQKGTPSTWTRTRLRDNKHNYAGGALHGVYVASENEIWMAGNNRQLYKTTDGGQNWTQIGGLPSEISGFEAIDGQGDHMFLIGLSEGGQGGQDGIILQSTDGGQTWSKQTEGPPLNFVEFVNEDLAYAWSDGPGGSTVRWSR